MSAPAGGNPLEPTTCSTSLQHDHARADFVPRAEIVEVGPRDGFQTVPVLIPTDTKIAVLKGIYDAGVKRVEVTSFVSRSAIPQLADAAETLVFAATLPGLDAQVLVPSARHAARALSAHARHLVFVISVLERHNMSNVRRTVSQSLAEYSQIVAMLPQGSRMRVDIATAFDCPYEGRVDESKTLALLDLLVAHKPTVEIALCDTTGRAVPSHVASLFTAAIARTSNDTSWAFHAHDTYGLGAANVLAAWQTGVRVFDASLAGLGGCPYTPGATGNVATEDLVWMFEGMGIATGINLDALLSVARRIASLPEAQVGGRVRHAMAARPSSYRCLDRQ